MGVRARKVGLCVFAAIAIFALSVVAQSGTFTTTGSMSISRSSHTATLLPNGKVLIAGGTTVTANLVADHFVLASAELYNPATGVFTPTGSMSTERVLHTATLLHNGKVLIAGGIGGLHGGIALASAELYDPATGTFSPTGSMTVPHFDFAATLVPDSKVVLVGGPGAVFTAELYDPVSGTFSPANLPKACDQCTVTLLTDGKVLIAGGHSILTGNRADLYDPATGLSSITGNMTTRRGAATASLLSNGKVLVAGGFNDVSGYLGSAELYDPATGIFATTGSMSNGRILQTATVLPNEKVLIAGGFQSLPRQYLSSAELYNPTARTFNFTGSMLAGRASHTATLLANGRVLIVGGISNLIEFGHYAILASAELYNSEPPPNRPPIAIAGANQTVECAGRNGAIVRLDGSGSSDPDGDALSFMWKDENDNTVGTAAVVSVTVPLGSHNFSLTVSDSHGNRASASLTVTVRDTSSPTLSVTLSPNVLWPADHKLVGVTAIIQSNDVCDANPRVALLAVTSNEPDNGQGDGDTPNDIQGVTLNIDDRSFLLRAERSSKGKGRVYTVTYRATDASGNVRTTTAQATVPVNQGKKE